MPKGRGNDGEGFEQGIGIYIQTSGKDPLIVSEEELNIVDDSFMTGRVETPTGNEHPSINANNNNLGEQEPKVEVLDEDGFLPEERQQFQPEQDPASDGIQVGYSESNFERVRQTFDVSDLDREQEMQILRERAKARRKFNLIITAFSVLLLGGIAAWIFLGKPLAQEEIGPEIPQYQSELNDLITMMYTANGVEDLASANEMILEYFDETVKDSFDIRDSNVYAERYSYFHNAPISVKISETYQADSTLFIRYIIECEVASPLTRIAIVDINDQGKITDFDEYNTY